MPLSTESYFEILTDLMLGHTIEVFSENAKRELTQQPKFYFFDGGIVRALREPTFQGFDSIAKGKNLEGLIFNELRCWLQWKKIKKPVWFWRTRKKIEVDFIISPKPGELWAIEVKHSDRIRTDDLIGLIEFKKDYPNARLFYLYRGKSIEKIHDIEAYPVDYFLKNILWSTA